MKLLFKQRFFSWFDSYDIYNEAGETVYTVKGTLAWGHLLRIYDAKGEEIGYIREKSSLGFLNLKFILGSNILAASVRNFHFFGRNSISISMAGKWMGIGWNGNIRS